MTLDEKIISCYEYFVKSTSSSVRYKFARTSAKEKIIQKFLSMVDDQYGGAAIGIGSHWVFEYTLFQINRYFDSKEYDSRDVFGWFYGPKAFDRWVNKAAGWRYGIAHGVQSKYRFTESVVIGHIEGHDMFDKTALMKKHEDKTRAKKDFIECLSKTTLYHPMTRYCRTCPAKDDCKKILESRHPQIYVKRCQ